MFGLGSILGALTGLIGPIISVTERITDLKIEQAKSKTDVEKAKIQRDIQEAEDRQQVLVAEAGFRINATMRWIIALGPTVYLTKLFIWDKVLGSLVGCTGAMAVTEACSTFKTDGLDSNLWWVVLAIIAFYFSYDIAARLRK